jgi:hypothetical protein
MRQLEINYVERLVAFIDILGFAEMVIDDEPSVLDTIRLLDGRLRHVREVWRDDWGDLSVKLFSDCICISCRPEDCAHMLYELAFLQFYLSMDGIFLRGGLALGKHFENDLMIFSKGLVEAYQLERMALYPRIVVAEGVVQGKEQPYYTAGTWPTQSLVMRDPDGTKFVDYIEFSMEEGMEQADFFSAHKKAILHQVARHSTTPRIIDKYLWVARYHNAKFAHVFGPPEDWHDDYYRELRRAAWIDPDTELPAAALP